MASSTEICGRGRVVGPLPWWSRARMIGVGQRRGLSPDAVARLGAGVRARRGAVALVGPVRDRGPAGRAPGLPGVTGCATPAGYMRASCMPFASRQPTTRERDENQAATTPTIGWRGAST